jgi:hypothetical protein
VRGIDEVLHREITAEQYARAKAKNGYLTKEDRETAALLSSTMASIMSDTHSAQRVIER